jgi:hypothetical protein
VSIAAFSTEDGPGATGRAIQVGVGILPLLAALVAPSASHGRPLTEGERAFLAPLFRDAVDYDAVRIVRGPAFPLQGRRTIVTLGRAIYAPSSVYVADYARAAPERRAILVHEVAHVWQFESGIAVIAGAIRAFFAAGGRYSRAYRYQLAPGRDLIEYGIEQQASILEHYFLARGTDQVRYAGVLRRFLDDPRYPRHRTAAATPRPGRRAPRR